MKSNKSLYPLHSMSTAISATASGVCRVAGAACTDRFARLVKPAGSVLRTLPLLFVLTACQTPIGGIPQGGQPSASSKGASNPVPSGGEPASGERSSIPSIPSETSSSQPSSAPSNSSSNSSTGDTAESSSTKTKGAGSEKGGNEQMPGENAEALPEVAPEWVDDEEWGDDELANGEQGNASEQGAQRQAGEVGDLPEQPDFETQGGLSEEEIEELEQELEKSFTDFDADMQREKEIAEQRANQSTADGGIGGIGDFEDYDESKQEGQGSQSQDDSSGSADSGTSAQAGNANSDGNANAKSGTDSTSDKRTGPKSGDVLNQEDEQGDAYLAENDDVVARQLRELAESETDPALKKQYWQDYRNYKSGN